MKRTFAVLCLLLALLICPALGQTNRWVDFSPRHRVLLDLENPSAKEEVLEFPGFWEGDSSQAVRVKAVKRSKGYSLSVKSPKGKRLTKFVSNKKALAHDLHKASLKSEK